MSNHSSIKYYSPADGFLKSYRNYPGKTALVVDGVSYTYEQLMNRAYTIYRNLGEGKEHKRIAIYCSGTVFSYAAVLATAIYGACYVPLNPKFPVERNLHYVRESGATLILSDQELSVFETIPGVETCTYDPQQDYPSCSINIIEKVEQDLAYILFTSGTTGIPKGVPVSKSNLFHFFSFFLSEYDFGTDDGFLQPYEFTFDVSVFSMFMPWQIGACCYAVPQSGLRYLDITALLKKYPVTVTSMVPGVLRFLEKYLPELNLPKVRYSFFSGDALSHKLAVKWKMVIPNGEIHNFYGPTETTIVCTRYKWKEEQSSQEAQYDIVPLGTPFPGMDVLITGENDLPVEEGMTGELCFSGTQVIEEYLGETNPGSFFIHQNKTWYKTGDLASVNKNGNLIFHGRTDAQVKINGYRVEPAEVEEKIRELASGDCFVFCLKDKMEMNYLAAVVTGSNMDTALLKIKLSGLLPDYMIPRRIATIDKLPLTLNGKADRQQLKQWLNEQHYIT